MKKTLLATTLLVATAGLAAAEVTLSGSGRFGLVYDGTDTTIHTRLRVNIDAKMETDGGVTFGGRIRLQHENNDPYVIGVDSNGNPVVASGARLSAAMLYMETGGLRVEVGNANGAYDSAGLIWNSEIGFTDSSYGDPNAAYIGYFHSGPYNAAGDASQDAMSLFASYSAGDFTGRVSYHDYDQNNGTTADTETSLSLDYAAGSFAVSAAYVTSDYYGQDNYALGAQYSMGDSTNVGLLFFGGDAPDLITLYANHTLANGLTLAGYVADQDTYDTAFGIGASYPLGGGAAIKGAYHDRGAENMADFGVTFSF